MVILLTVISDNIRVYLNKKNRLVSNTVGFIYAFILGPEYLLISSIVILFSRTKHTKIGRKIYRTLIFSASYSLAAAFSYGYNPLLSIFLFLTFSKIINSIFVEGFKEFELKIFLYEYFYFLSLLPLAYLYTLTIDFGFKYAIISLNVLILILFYLMMKLETEKSDEKLRNIRIGKLNRVIGTLSNIIRDLSLKVPGEKVLDYIAEILKTSLGYEYVLISLFDYRKNEVIRVTQRGIGQEKYEMIKNTFTPISEVMKFIKEKYQYGDTFFIPNADKINEAYTFQPRDVVNVDYLSENQNLWDPNDLLLLILRDERENIVGYISLDSPESGLRPSKEELDILTVFARLVSLALEHSQKFSEIKDQSERDSLTGLYNHSKLFSDLMSYEHNKDKIYLVFIDLDDFKNINDKYGHKYGDEILKKFSQIVMRSLRGNDKVYRYGGDEFVIIFRNITKENVVKVINRIYDELEKTNLGITFSAGVSFTDESPENYKHIVEIADKKMYQSKKSGKGQIIE
jgi:diguanylate cyclase (GGDEF)-like protein